ncbi:hypothetical protein [Phaeodactylibacter xiamenensis]|uniref:hypothetical protein n=1 Tax=Phaeodactylibacter xiamenensis TaxID=1524460 RepID=UPI0024A9DA3F|nr:hypothetical protein [Phaeodactylibacter xiamenensis]
MTTQQLKNIINHYKKWKRENPDTWIKHCENQEELENAITFAALAENHLGKRNGHQRRLKKLDLEKFAANLIDNKDKIEAAKTFDELLKVVESCKIKGVGELTCYDTANRIGAKLKLKPDLIYLHAGTKKGAEKLLGMKLRDKCIRKVDLPAPFQTDELTPAEIEDILCIYKDRFDKVEIEKIKNCS